MYRLDLAQTCCAGDSKSDSCDCGAEQMAYNIASGRCPTYRSLVGIQGLIDLDFDTQSCFEDTALAHARRTHDSASCSFSHYVIVTDVISVISKVTAFACKTSSSGCPNVSAKSISVLRHSTCCCHHTKHICDVLLTSLSWVSSTSFPSYHSLHYFLL